MKSTWTTEVKSKLPKINGAPSDVRTMLGLALTFASLVALLLLVSCAPKVVDRVYAEPKLDFGALQKDPDLGLSTSNAVVTPDRLKWKESVDSARVFRFAEALTRLGQLQAGSEKKASLINLGERIGRSFYKARGTTTKNAFKDSLYISAAIGETKADVLPILKENDDMLLSQLPLIHEAITNTASHMTWPTAETPAKSALLAARSYADDFIARASDSKINRDIVEGVRATFQKDFYPLLDGLATEVDSIMAEPRPVIMIRRLKEIAKKYEFDLGADATKMMEQAEGIMVDIEAIEKNHDALTVIVELWEMTDVANREKTFRPVSEDLFKYLNGKSPKDLRCVKDPGCHNPLIWLPKKIGLLPAIEKYGLDKLKVDINKAARDSLIKTIQEEVAKFVPTIPTEIETKVTAEIAKIRQKLANVKSDYPGFIRGIALEYEKQGLKDKDESDEVVIAGLETKRVRMDFSKAGVSVSSDTNTDSGTTTGAEVIGSSMSYMASLWTAKPDDSYTYKKSIVTQINKMLSLGGYRTPSGKPFPSISLAIPRNQNNSVRHFSISEDSASKSTFAVPNSFSVSNNLIPAADTSAKDVSVRGQAELLRGLSGMVRYFRDWEQNGFDETLGKVQIGKLIKDLPAGSVKQKLFPKDTFFALAVGNSASILQNLTKDLSPILLVDINRKSLWANERAKDGAQPATLAGIVDIVKGQRTQTVKAADAARFLLAIADFIEATDGIENTKAAPLIKPGADGQTPVEMILQARNQLGMLIVGIGNFISHELQSADGGIRSTYERETLSTNAAEPRTAGDQAVCILALLTAGESIGKQIYDWSALDAYAFMNRKLFNHATGFYSMSETSKELPSADDIANILLAGEVLKSRMTDKSRDQWNRIATPWLKAFTTL